MKIGTRQSRETFTSIYEPVRDRRTDGRTGKTRNAAYEEDHVVATRYWFVIGTSDILVFEKDLVLVFI